MYSFSGFILVLSYTLSVSTHIKFFVLLLFWQRNPQEWKQTRILRRVLPNHSFRPTIYPWLMLLPLRWAKLNFYCLRFSAVHCLFILPFVCFLLPSSSLSCLWSSLRFCFWYHCLPWFWFIVKVLDNFHRGLVLITFIPKMWAPLLHANNIIKLKKMQLACDLTHCASPA